MADTLEWHEVIARLVRIEASLQSLVDQRMMKDWYSTSEVASMLGKSEYTMREWCRLGRVQASKKPYAYGAHCEWLIGHEELRRLRNEGLLPICSKLF